MKRRDGKNDGADDGRLSAQMVRSVLVLLFVADVSLTLRSSASVQAEDPITPGGDEDALFVDIQLGPVSGATLRGRF